MPLRKDFVEEIQVKSAGYSAEFGGSTGGVINVITKSGTNNFRGGALFEAEQRKWGGDERPLLRDSLTSNTFTYINPPKDDETRIDPGFFRSAARSSATGCGSSARISPASATPNGRSTSRTA